jgi:chemotaxis signal transduction protein
METLALTDSQSYAVSKFEPSTFANEQPTLIYAAAVRGPDRRAIGGVAVVFDTAPQLKAMLLDTLPRDERGEPLAGSVAVFLDRDGKVMSTTDPALEMAGPMLDGVRENLADGGARAVRIGSEYYALGAKQDAGYREYVGIGAHAVVLLPLGAVPERSSEVRLPLPQCTGARSDHARVDVREFTTFSTGGGWYALPTSCVVEAVDAKAVQPVTTAGPRWAGVLMHGGEAVPVVNLAALLERPGVDECSMVILLRVEGRSGVVGILVEALGDNPEGPSDRLLPVSVLEQTAATVLVEQAIQPVDDRDGLVLVVNTVQLGAMLFGAGAAQRAA